GWPLRDPAKEKIVPHQAFVDAGYQTDVVYTFCRESGKRFAPAVGRGASQQHRQWYDRPTQTGSTWKLIGEGYHVNWLPPQQIHLFEVDADHWKSFAHQRLSTPLTSAGAMTLFRAQAQEHLSLARHLTAEVKTEEFVSGKGVVVKWER